MRMPRSPALVAAQHFGGNSTKLNRQIWLKITLYQSGSSTISLHAKQAANCAKNTDFPVPSRPMCNHNSQLLVTVLVTVSGLVGSKYRQAVA
jgi:hypothetical protein